MTTNVIITGTGCPLPSADRAGPGVLVTHGEVHLQFDVGRATLLRLMAAGSSPGRLTAVFLTHHHSDHLAGLEDLVMTRWIMDRTDELDPLPIVAPEGPAVTFAERMLDAWEDDLSVRRSHSGRDTRPGIEVVPFPDPNGLVEVWRQDDVVVKAGQVRHEPVQPAVGFRIETPDGVVAITGDTLVCDEVAELADGADVLVYEALRVCDIPPDAPNAFILDYHADTLAIGKQAAELATPTLVLTHLIPPPTDEAGEQAFVDDIRGGGYEGELIVARDLTTVSLG